MELAQWLFSGTVCVPFDQFWDHEISSHCTEAWRLGYFFPFSCTLRLFCLLTAASCFPISCTLRCSSNDYFFSESKWWVSLWAQNSLPLCHVTLPDLNFSPRNSRSSLLNLMCGSIQRAPLPQLTAFPTRPWTLTLISRGQKVAPDSGAGNLVFSVTPWPLPAAIGEKLHGSCFRGMSSCWF